MSAGVGRACREPLRETSHLRSRNYRAAKSLCPFMRVALVYAAENGDDVDAKIHKNTSAMSAAIGPTPSAGRPSALLKSSKKLAHRVSYGIGSGTARVLGSSSSPKIPSSSSPAPLKR